MDGFGNSASAQDWSQLLASLRDAGIEVSTSSSDREHRSQDQSYLPAALADAVVFAQSTKDVCRIVALCREARCPIVPWGAGTSVEGHVAALRGGVTLDLSRMSAVLRVDTDDFDCTVQAGVTREALNQYLRDTGLFFPIDACPQASIGGMVNTRASGTNAVRYGTMRENVLNVTAVLIDGRVVKTASRARKSAAGYDLTRLMVGSGGTLGIVTEVTLRLHPIPEHQLAAVCAFPTVGDAAQAVVESLQAGVSFAKVEFVDEVQIEWSNRFSNLDLELKPHLFFEFDGTEQSIAHQAALVESIARDHHGSAFKWAADPQDRARLWHARHQAYYAAVAARPGCLAWPTDVTVPISRLGECIAETRRDLDTLPFKVPMVGHVGDGNFHLCFMLDPTAPHEHELAREVNDRMVRRAISMEGTCTGEHGVGHSKNKWLEEEFGADTLSMMRDIKRALDPLNLLNPGKMFSVDPASPE